MTPEATSDRKGAEAAITRIRYFGSAPPTGATVMPHNLIVLDFIIEIEMTAVFNR